MRTLTLYPFITETQFHDRTRWTLLIGTLVLVALLLFGCLSTQAHWDSETVKPDGTVVRTSRGYKHQDTRLLGDAVAEGAGGVSQFLNDSGLSSINPIIGLVSGGLGILGGLWHGRRVKAVGDANWDEATAASANRAQPIVVLGSPTGSIPGGPTVQTSSVTTFPGQTG